MNEAFMQPQTLATLEELKRAQWFRFVGIRDTERADVLTSWGDAVASCGSDAWQELVQEAANQFSERLAERNRERFNRWNETAMSLKPITAALVGEKTATVVSEHGLPKVFIDTVKWDILHVCMEAEYADIYPPGFFASQAYWYVKGHFPCGWRGEFPQGNLVVY